ncbi:response regulator [Thiocystis violascens]|uniref:Response regulator with CheY-like receiver domain and winged-helix DNA-binding domain n=1 Tax=Thiocystis violascens (strain ATCC 17096 / DSM 198 / 6111) TaxID=765911 RepID=I3Y5X7_THIV6|nr:response regulator [Thiocystis violascens]AFL72395.1 response regulator with CheY-like receiver domain and winged-helix DNA-binding domain [Thiocystis violascens DSM 198]
MKRILVIDDAATVRLYHRNILEAAGFAVSEAVNGLEALERVAESPFDLYLVDINMPKLDGYGFLRELRGKDIPQAPAIMVSTEAAANDQKLAYVSGANLYLIKPVRPERLLAHVLTLLGLASLPPGGGSASDVEGKRS